MSSPAAQLIMLKDGVRTLQYRAAIFEHARDRVVLDLGCGSGVLSIFAAQAGARRVYAVERSSVAVLARLMFKANHVEDRVTLLKEDSRRVTLPEPVDLIMHEILGSDPLAEGLIPAIDDARARLLAPGGKILPGRIEIGCVGLEALGVPLAAERITEETAQLGALYGVDLSPLDLALQTWDTAFRQRPDLGDRALDRLLTNETILWDLDLSRPLAAQIDAPVNAKLTSRHPGRLGAVMVFFRAHLGERLILSTSPFAPRTHWGFSAWDLSRTVAVGPGDAIPITARVDDTEGRHTVVVDL